MSPCRTNDQGSDFIPPKFPSSPDNTLKSWYHKCQGLSGACHGLYYDVLVLHEQGNGRGLNGCHLGMTHGLDHVKARENVSVEKKKAPGKQHTSNLSEK